MVEPNSRVLSPLANALLAVTSLACGVAGCAVVVRAGGWFGPALKDRSWQSFAELCGTMLGGWLGVVAAATAVLLLCTRLPIRRLALAADAVLRCARNSFTIGRIRRRPPTGR
jgi:hypothetical protein